MFCFVLFISFYFCCEINCTGNSSRIQISHPSKNHGVNLVTNDVKTKIIRECDILFIHFVIHDFTLVIESLDLNYIFMLRTTLTDLNSVCIINQLPADEVNCFIA